MTVPAEAAARRDLVVVPDHEGTEWTIRRIAVPRHNKVVTRLQPAMIALIKRLFGSNLQHGIPECGPDGIPFWERYATQTTG
jgi:hypothetical protein